MSDSLPPFKALLLPTGVVFSLWEAAEYEADSLGIYESLEAAELAAQCRYADPDIKLRPPEPEPCKEGLFNKWHEWNRRSQQLIDGAGVARAAVYEVRVRTLAAVQADSGPRAHRTVQMIRHISKRQ